MKTIILELPTWAHKERANAFKEEFFESNETIINGSGLLDQLDYDAWLEHTTKYRDNEMVDEDWVPSTTFFAVRKADNEIVGMVDIRHHINHPFLSEYGGHIGYAVRPTQRQQGYATLILVQALEYAQELGLDRVMLGCYADNEASIRTISKYGELAEKKQYIDGKPMMIYWIDTSRGK